MDTVQSEHAASLSQGLATPTRFLLECDTDWPFPLADTDILDSVNQPSFAMPVSDRIQTSNPVTPPDALQPYQVYCDSLPIPRPPTPPMNNTKSNATLVQADKPATTKRLGRKRRAESDTNNGEREKLLERNRVAALKCRQKKKKWMQELEEQSELVSTRNKQLRRIVSDLREESMFLRNQLLAHGNCNCTMVQSYLQRTSAQLAAAKDGN